MAKPIYFFGPGKTDGDASQRELLGGKGAGLAELARLGIPVPPGFTLTTEVCTAFFARGEQLPDGIDDAVREAIARVEAEVGARFGDPERPLLVSVRSGARASMPGMMDTILNLGLNDRLAEGLARRTSNRRFALDAYRRLLLMYSDVVLGVSRRQFEQAQRAAREARAAALGIDASRLTAAELERRVPDSMLDEPALERIIAQSQSIVLQATGKPFPEDPFEQLRGAIVAVFRSWNTPRAKVYRAKHEIPAHWGTACNVQAMVFGNLGDDSGTGVAFTRDPATGERRLYGDWLPNAQGEDVVAGTRTPMPLPKDDPRNDPENALETRMPEVFRELVGYLDKLEKHFRDVQDVEFTIERGRLWILQQRAAKRSGHAAVRAAVDMAREGLIDRREAVLRVEPSALDQLLHPTLDEKAPRTTLARGVGASAGAATGAVVFDADEAERRAGQGKAVILVRNETSPDDIHGMIAARGILTAKGGQTSHAALVARGYGKACVVGCSALHIDARAQSMAVTTYDDAGRPKETVTISAGDVITLDGATGHVYLGAVPTRAPSLSGEFAELMRWAGELARLRVRANADTPRDAHTARGFGAEGIGLCRTEHMFFGEDRIPVMREMILADDAQARRSALARLLPFQRDDFAGIFRTMAGLPVTIRLLDPPLHEFVPDKPEQIEELARITGRPARELERRCRQLHEHNPMLGHRGCRLAITYPEIYEMQVRAILEAACDVAAEGVAVLPEIMIPLAITRRELAILRELVTGVAERVFAEKGRRVEYKYGTMIELPRACVMAGELAEVAEFFSFGTNDLTQTTLGLSRDDAGKFLGAYVEAGILPKDPFVTVDAEGVGALVEMACARGRAARGGLKLGICGEHGGDPDSVHFFERAGLDYVSCSPFRVPIARLAAAQAALKSAATGAKATD